jgi:predicted amidohydrolase
MSVVEGDKEKTIARALENITRAADADLVVLPEIWNVGFMSFDRYESEAEDREGPTLTALRQAAREVDVFLHTGSFVEKDGDDYFNSSYLLSPEGDILANYRKIHLFGHNSRETQILKPGEKVIVADTPLGRIGMATCYDLRFPRARAMENQCFLVSANSVGSNLDATFVGHSMMINPWGVILASGGDEDVILKSEIDLPEVNSAREHFSAYHDRVSWLS